MAIPTVPVRTAMFDDAGNLTRTWILFFQSLGTSTVTTTSIAPTAGGVATPDLGVGVQFRLILTADVTLALPVNVPVGVQFWILIVQQDSVGGHSLMTPGYAMGYPLATAGSPANTESVQSFTSDATYGTRAVAAPMLDQAIPTVVAGLSAVPSVVFFESVSGGTGAVTPTITVTPSAGIATPDLALGIQFRLVLTADTTLALPLHPTANPTDWVLIVQQDSTGGHSLMSSAYPMGYSLATANSPGSTESIQMFTTDSSGTRGAAAALLDQKIP